MKGPGWKEMGWIVGLSLVGLGVYRMDLLGIRTRVVDKLFPIPNEKK